MSAGSNIPELTNGTIECTAPSTTLAAPRHLPLEPRFVWSKLNRFGLAPHAAFGAGRANSLDRRLGCGSKYSCSRVPKRAKTPRIRTWNRSAIRKCRPIAPFDRNSQGRSPRRSPMAAAAADTAAVSMTVNGKPISATVDPRTLLVQLLRETLRLTGTHVGCDTSQCGACVVLVNGKAIKSCTVLALQIEGADVLTIEGLAPADGPLHPMQEAFRENHGLQCGYCTPGMILTAVDMVRRKGNELDDHTIREELG